MTTNANDSLVLCVPALKMKIGESSVSKDMENKM